jgi:hypothetical protein
VNEGDGTDLDSVAEDLMGRALHGVRYLVFPEWWDNGNVHERIMAVELVTDLGAIYTVTWSQSPEVFSIDVRPIPLASFKTGGRPTPFGDLSSGGDLCSIEMIEHDRWSSLLPTTIDAATVGWGVSAASDSAPIALRLAVGPSSVWIATGERQTDTWYWGMDELTIVFGDSTASAVGLSSAVSWAA